MERDGRESTHNTEYQILKRRNATDMCNETIWTHERNFSKIETNTTNA